MKHANLAPLPTGGDHGGPKRPPPSPGRDGAYDSEFPALASPSAAAAATGPKPGSDRASGPSSRPSSKRHKKRHTNQRADTIVRRFWGNRDCCFDVTMRNLDADSYWKKDPERVLAQAAAQKKSKHLNNCIEHRRDFTPLVFSRDAIIDREASSALKCIARKCCHCAAWNSLIRKGRMVIPYILCRRWPYREGNHDNGKTIHGSLFTCHAAPFSRCSVNTLQLRLLIDERISTSSQEKMGGNNANGGAAQYEYQDEANDDDASNNPSPIRMGANRYQQDTIGSRSSDKK